MTRDVSFKHRLFLSTAMVGAFFGYGRQSYAACANSGGTTYLCSGSNAAGLSVSHNEAAVSTASGFSVNTAASNAITITGDGAISFTDTNASTIAAVGHFGLVVNAAANDGGTPGSATINSNSTISGTYGMVGYNYGTGALSITANGDVTGTAESGILAFNYGSNLTVTTGAGSHVTGGYRGIDARNYGTGAFAITVDGDVTGGTNRRGGINAINGGTGTSLTVTTGVGSHVTGDYYGIRARNNGSGALAITVDGDVTGTGANRGTYAVNHGIHLSGIYAINHGTSLSVTTGAGTAIAGFNYGIYANSQGSGALSITVNGDVTGTDAASKGIYAKSTHASNSITVQDGSVVSGTIGIKGATATQLNVTLDGTASPVTVTGTGGTAISLGNANNSLTLAGTVAINGNVTSGSGANTLALHAGTTTISSGHSISGFQTLNVTGVSTVNGTLNFSGNNLTITGSGNGLSVNGALAATSLTVGSGASFGGNNTFTGNLIIGNGGTLAPGDPTTTNVTGNLNFNTGSTFLVQIDGVSSDRVNATGNVTIAAGTTLDIVPLAGFSGGSSATFLTAGGTLSGTFNTIDTNGLVATVIYDAHDVTLLTASPSAINVQALSLQRTSLLFGDTVADASALGALATEKYLWSKALFTHNSRDATGNYKGFSDNIYGFAAGGEGNAAEHWKLGFALGQLENNAGVTASADQFRGSGTFASIYTTYIVPNGIMDLFATSGVTGSYHTLDGKRSVTNSGVPATARTDSDALATGAFAQLGLRSSVGNGWSLLPKVGVSYTHINAGGFNEHGGGLAGISMDGYSFGAWKTSEDITLAHESGVNLFGITVVPHLSLGLSQEYASGSRSAHGHFSNGTPLTLAFDRSNTNFVTTGAGLDFKLAEAVTGFVQYQNATSRNEAQNTAKAGVTIKF